MSAEKVTEFVDSCSNCPTTKVETTPTGKIVDTKEFPDGRKAVTVHVNALNIENPDDGDEAARKVIEGQILPELANRVVLVTVIHRRTLLKATVKTKAMKVRQVAETLIAGFPQPTHELSDPKPEDFIIVEVEGDDVRVTSLV
jgi:hypothetical protein